MMHIENLHQMIEDMSEYGKKMVKCGTSGSEEINLKCASEVTDMIKDLCEAEYYAKISKAMDNADKEQEEEDKYMFQRMKEEYGEDEGQRYYNDYRYANGRFAPKGRGTRRSYGTRYHIPEMYYPDRDLDRADGRMYYDGGMPHESRSYSDGYNEGQDMGYKRGYEEGRRSTGNTRDYREGRSGRSRRTYMETKETKDNSPEAKQAKMRELEKYMNELSSDVTEMISDASQEERNMLKNKLQNLQSKIQ